MNTHIIPFGSNCRPASIIRKGGGIRKYHLPFDWVFAYPWHIKKSLDNDFRDWLDTDQMKLKMGIGDVNSTDHAGYLLTSEHYFGGSTGFFEHFDMTNPENQNKYFRAITRFRYIMESNDRVVFLTTLDKEELEEHGLLNYFDRDNVEFVQVKHIESDLNTLEFEESDKFTVIKQLTASWEDLWGSINTYLIERYDILFTGNFEGIKEDIF
jgi:hypothetical protein